MPPKNRLNEKRLSRKQVQELIADGAVLHETYTACFAETYPNGYQNQPLVYQLEDDRFLYVFDPTDASLGGKGDLYDRAYLLRWLDWLQRVRKELQQIPGSSVEHWYFYSRYKNDLMLYQEALMIELAEWLSLPIAQLNYSYASLDRLSAQAEASGVEAVQQEFYDHLVVYVGEVLRRRLQEKGIAAEWTIDRPTPEIAYPAIRANGGTPMPVKVVWNELMQMGLEPMNLRKETANEMRRFRLLVR